MGAVRPLIVTARMDDHAQARLDALRQAHFPPERNWLAAHVTLFHALPGVERPQIEQGLVEELGQSGPVSATVSEVRFTGNGVSFDLHSPALATLRRALAARFAPWLTRQDQQGYRPHVTIQNKTAPEVARALHASLSAGFHPFDLAITGLDLWHYDGGPWEIAARFPAD
jgi:2'-5' RNA ligase